MGLCPKPGVWGELIIFRRKKSKNRKKKILEPLRLWSGARPFSPLGEEPVGRLGVLVPLGPDAYIASCALEIRHAPIGGCPCPHKPDNAPQEETRLKVIYLPELQFLKSGNFVALKR
jgi:hypothetical protein